MTQDFEESARNFLSLLNKLPSTPSITFRGFVDTSVTQARIVVSPALTATSHSIAIATNNLRTPPVGAGVVVCGAREAAVALVVAEASLDAPEEYYRDVYDEYVERRKCLIDGLNRIPGVYSPIPMGAFYTVAKLPVDDSEKFCRWCLEVDFDRSG